MEISAVVGSIVEQETPALVLGIYQGPNAALSDAAVAVDAALAGTITDLMAEGDFRGKTNETLVLYADGRLPAKRVVLVGLGKQEEMTADVVRQTAATAAKQARSLGLPELHIAVIDSDTLDLSFEQIVEAMAEGVWLGLYRFTELKTQDEDSRPDPEHIGFLVAEGDAARATQAILNGRIVAGATILARDLVNRPANIASPAAIAAKAQEIGAAAGLNCTILDKATLTQLGMHLLLSVNQGSEEPARLIILEHNAGKPDLPTIVLVGKGITFDTGGISLKNSQGMEQMKGDMGGAAAVLSVLQAVAQLDLPLHVVGLAPVTENMPDARATKPGDVKRSLKGLTVEIINTDAEGRLILADALTYAGQYAPDAIFDIATLTGGRIVALGDHAAAVMGDDALIKRLRDAGDATRERVWPLPLFKEYGKQLESDVADLKNVGGRAASSITAGFFLSKFVPDDTAWVHIDIAGLEFSDKASAYVPKGSTGFGVRLLLETLRRWLA
ncbi:MAG: leucyl aminopeptidase [Anaerolineae bacterium]|nr:leucyl aminopeptidase [Anaerolineae bacterium]